MIGVVEVGCVQLREYSRPKGCERFEIGVNVYDPSESLSMGSGT